MLKRILHVAWMGVLVVMVVAVGGGLIAWKLATIFYDPHPLEALFGIERGVNIPGYGFMPIEECKRRGLCMDRPTQIGAPWHRHSQQQQ
jgi:hypothetical protein